VSDFSGWGEKTPSPKVLYSCKIKKEFKIKEKFSTHILFLEAGIFKKAQRVAQREIKKTAKKSDRGSGNSRRRSDISKF